MEWAVLILALLFVFLWVRAESRCRRLLEEKGALLAGSASDESLRKSMDVFFEVADNRFKPVEEAIERFYREMGELEKDRTFAYASLLEQVKGLRFAKDELQKETRTLSQALRKPHVRGKWGEIQLRRVVEMAGMTSHVDFLEQVFLEGEGGVSRPDLIVQLPQGKRIIVDAKAPLQAYLEAIEVDTEEEKKNKLKEHARHVKTHLTQLGSKAYWEKINPTPEFVVLFLPGEAFFSGALEYDPTLIDFGLEKGVLLASPTTLIALLKSVAYGWKQEALKKHVEEISNQGKKLYEALKPFSRHLIDMRKGLEKTVHSFNQAVGSYERNILSAARRFETFGVGSEGGLETTPPLENVLRSIVDDLPDGGSEAI